MVSYEINGMSNKLPYMCKCVYVTEHFDSHLFSLNGFVINITYYF